MLRLIDVGLNVGVMDTLGGYFIRLMIRINSIEFVINIFGDAESSADKSGKAIHKLNKILTKKSVD